MLALERDRRKMAISSTRVSRLSNIMLSFILDESKGQPSPVDGATSGVGEQRYIGSFVNCGSTLNEGISVRFGQVDGQNYSLLIRLSIE